MSAPIPYLSIIIVNWNVRDLLRACLESLRNARKQIGLEVIVVDAGSVDGSAEMVRTQFPWVHIIAHTENVGFPRGNNIGLRHARGRYIMLLNPDTEVVGNALATLLSYLDENPGVGAVGPQLRYADGSIQSSRRRFPTLVTAFVESTWLEPWAPSRILEQYRMLDQPDESTIEADWLVGAAIMVRREALEEAGPMDQDYFMYSEDLDWCRRIKEAGWRIVYLPSAQIVHHESKSSEQAVTARHINFQRAKLRYFRKYHGRLACSVLRGFLLAMYGFQLIIEATKGVLGHKRTLRWQRTASYWQVLKSGLRPAGY